MSTHSANQATWNVTTCGRPLSSATRSASRAIREVSCSTSSRTYENPPRALRHAGLAQNTALESLTPPQAGQAIGGPAVRSCAGVTWVGVIEDMRLLYFCRPASETVAGKRHRTGHANCRRRSLGPGARGRGWDPVAGPHPSADRGSDPEAVLPHPRRSLTPGGDARAPWSDGRRRADHRDRQPDASAARSPAARDASGGQRARAAREPRHGTRNTAEPAHAREAGAGGDGRDLPQRSRPPRRARVPSLRRRDGVRRSAPSTSHRAARGTPRSGGDGIRPARPRTTFGGRSGRGLSRTRVSREADTEPRGPDHPARRAVELLRDGRPRAALHRSPDLRPAERGRAARGPSGRARRPGRGVRNDGPVELLARLPAARRSPSARDAGRAARLERLGNARSDRAYLRHPRHDAAVAGSPDGVGRGWNPTDRRGIEGRMKAIAVHPRTRKVELIEHEPPRLTAATHVKLRMLEVGVCGTDREICAFQYGTPPEGESRLVIGHESLGEVVDVGTGVTQMKPGDLVVPMVRRPCSHASCVACRAGRQDFCFTGDFAERGINKLHGFMTELVVDDERYMHVVPPALRDVAVLVEPLTIAEKALLQVDDIQKRLPWACPSTAGAGRAACHQAVVLGAGPVGLLGAMALAARGFRTSIYS